MIGKLIGAAIGSKLDRRDGEGGFKGALMGVAGASLLRRSLPIAALVGGGIMAKRMMNRRRAATAAGSGYPATS